MSSQIQQLSHLHFRAFLVEADQNMKDVRESLSKIPKSHKALVRGYTFTFEAGNTLKKDPDHVGYVDGSKKKICVAAPWNYGRHFVLLHEIGHLVWKYFVTQPLRDEWSKIVKATRGKMKETEEELFCMAYGAFYSNHPPAIHSHPNWDKFIAKIARLSSK